MRKGVKGDNRELGRKRIYRTISVGSQKRVLNRKYQEIYETGNE